MALKGFDVTFISEVLKDVSGWLDSLDRDDLSLDGSLWSVDDDFLGVDEVSDDGEFLRFFSVVDIDDSSDLNEDFRIHF